MTKKAQTPKKGGPSSDQLALLRLAGNVQGLLFYGTPPASRTNRAEQTLLGRLAAGAPNVTDSFALPGYDTVVTAISPKGTVAILGVKKDKNGFRGELILRSPNGARTKPAHLWTSDKKFALRVFFVENSERPVVIAGTTLYWADWTSHLPTPIFEGEDCRLSSSAHLTVWREGDTRHVAYLLNGEIRHLVSRFASHTERVEPHFDVGHRAQWIGLVGGALAWIELEDKVQTLVWRRYRTSLARGSIFRPETIRVMNVDLVFLYTEQFRTHMGYAEPRSLNTVPVPESYIACLGEDEEGITFLDPDGWIHRFESSAFIHRKILADLKFIPPGQHGPWKMYSMQNGSTVFVGDTDNPVGQTSQWMVVLGADGSTVSYRGLGGLFNAAPSRHEGILTPTHPKDGALGFRWEIPVSADVPKIFADFPLYQLMYDIAAVTLEDNVRVLMGAVYTDGTLHIVQYNLPSQCHAK